MDLYSANNLSIMYYKYYSSDTSASSTGYSTRGSIEMGYPKPKPKKPEEDIKIPEPTLFNINEIELPEEKNDCT